MAPLVSYSLYNLNKTGDKQHPCLTPNLHTSRLPLVRSYFNTLIHVQFTDQSSFVTVDTSSHYDLH